MGTQAMLRVPASQNTKLLTILSSAIIVETPLIILIMKMSLIFYLEKN